MAAGLYPQKSAFLQVLGVPEIYFLACSGGAPPFKGQNDDLD